MLKITITTPCHESWDEMTAAENGRHCTTCAKTVVDFTLMSDEEVSNYFISRQRESVCGRFNNKQLNRILIQLPQNILHVTMPRWKQFLTACLLAFSSMLFSCDAIIDQYIKGEQRIESNKEVIGLLLAPIDTTVVQQDTLIDCTTLKGEAVFFESVTQGDIAIEKISLDSISIKPDSTNLIGKIAIDTNVSVPIKSLDSNKIKNPLKADSNDCNDVKYY